jgi:hypothetical protein
LGTFLFKERCELPARQEIPGKGGQRGGKEDVHRPRPLLLPQCQWPQLLLDQFPGLRPQVPVSRQAVVQPVVQQVVMQDPETAILVQPALHHLGEPVVYRADKVFHGSSCR